MSKNDAQVRVAITASDQSSQVIRQIGTCLEGMGAQASELGSVLTGFAGGFSMVGLVEIAKQAAEFGEAIEHASQKTGMAAEEISALKFAAENSGVGFEQLVQGIDIFDKNLVDLSGKGKGAKQALADLGISARDAHQHILPAHELLLKVADAFSKLPDGAEKTALAMALFGRSGADLIPMLDRGAAGIELLEAKAKSLGVVLGDDDVAAATAMREEFGRLQTGMTGLEFEIAKNLFPVLMTLFEAMLGNRNAIRAFVDALKLGGIGYFKVALQVIDPMGFYDSFVKGSTPNGQGISDMLGDKATSLFTDMKQQVADVNSAMLSLGLRVSPLGDTFGAPLGAHGRSGTRKAPASNAAAEDARIEQEGFNKAVRESQSLMKSMEQPVDALTKAYQDYADRLQEIQDLSTKLDTGPLWVASKAKFAEDLGNALAPVAQRVGDIGNNQMARQAGLDQLASGGGKNAPDPKALTELDTLGKKFGTDMGQAFNTLITGSANFGRVLEGLLTKFLELIVQMEIFKPLAAAFGGTRGGFAGAFFSSLAGARDSGGPVNYGQSYLVGESGPEIFTPSTAGSIMSNSDAQGQGGGGDVHYHIDARGADAGVERRIMRAMAKAGQQSAVNGYLLTREMAKRGA